MIAGLDKELDVLLGQVDSDATRRRLHHQS